MVFTNTSKTLMMRAARHLVEQAKALERSYGQNWACNKEARKAKLEYDRLLRDDRDLRALAKQLEKAAKDYDFERAAKVPFPSDKKMLAAATKVLAVGQEQSSDNGIRIVGEAVSNNG